MLHARLRAEALNCLLRSVEGVASVSSVVECSRHTPRPHRHRTHGLRHAPHPQPHAPHRMHSACPTRHHFDTAAHQGQLPTSYSALSAGRVCRLATHGTDASQLGHRSSRQAVLSPNPLQSRRRPCTRKLSPNSWTVDRCALGPGWDHRWPQRSAPIVCSAPAALRAQAGV